MLLSRNMPQLLSSLDTTISRASLLYRASCGCMEIFFINNLEFDKQQRVGRFIKQSPFWRTLFVMTKYIFVYVAETAVAL